MIYGLPARCNREAGCFNRPCGYRSKRAIGMLLMCRESPTVEIFWSTMSFGHECSVFKALHAIDNVTNARHCTFMEGDGPGENRHHRGTLRRTWSRTRVSCNDWRHRSEDIRQFVTRAAQRAAAGGQLSRPECASLIEVKPKACRSAWRRSNSGVRDYAGCI